MCCDRLPRKHIPLTPFLKMRFIVCFALFAFSALATADFPELFNTEPIPVSTLMPAEEAAKQFQVPDGFEVNVFASEPDVQNPIAMSWDSKGRLWIAENYTYAERGQRFQLDLRDRIVIFDNTRGKRFKKRTVFSDNLQMLTGLEVGHGGVWVMCPPKLIFIPDRDHDDIPDGQGEVVLDGFKVAQANYHNFANGLKFGPDGWLYGRCGGSCPGRIGLPGTPEQSRLALEGGIWRYHPTRKTVEVLTSGCTNPWGHDWNAVGEMFFVNTVNGHLWHMIPGAHYTRPFLLDPNPRVYEQIDFHADHWHFDTGQSWTKSRDGAANEYGGGHSHIGTMIYQANNWPRSYQGKLLTLNQHGRRANQEILQRQGSGYVAKHGKDILLSQDTWFQGIDIGTGPDGSVFVIDWSDTGECHEHTGVHRESGRVFKISYKGGSHETPASKVADFRTAAPKALLENFDASDSWSRRQIRLSLAQRVAAGEQLSGIKPRLIKQFAAADSSAEAVQWLLLMVASGNANKAFLHDQLSHADEHVRAWAIRLLTDDWLIDDALGSKQAATNRDLTVIPALVGLAQNDSSALVRLTLASAIQRLPIKRRAALADRLVGHAQDASDHNLPLMVWYGLIPVLASEPMDLVEVADGCKLPKTLRSISRSLAESHRKTASEMDALLGLVATSDDGDFQATVLAGIADGLRGVRRVEEPKSWAAVSAKLSDGPLANVVRELSVVFGDGRAMDDLKAIALGKTTSDYTLRMDALRNLIFSKPPDLRETCEKLLGDSRMNVLAAQGLSQFDDPKIGTALVNRYRNVRAPFRPQVMSILVSRKSFAKPMLLAMKAGKIPRSDLSAFQVRQILGFDDDETSRLLGEVWGEINETPAAKQKLISKLKTQLTYETIRAANKPAGRALFVKLCQNCHRLYGEGGKIGPDITGSNRSNLDYLLGNIVDPSGVVDKDFRMTMIVTEDGRSINGLVTAESDQTLSIQTATESVILNKDDILQRKVTDKSPMPEGMLDNLTDHQVRDLIAYLQHPTQVPLADQKKP